MKRKAAQLTDGVAEAAGEESPFSGNIAHLHLNEI